MATIVNITGLKKVELHRNLWKRQTPFVSKITQTMSNGHNFTNSLLPFTSKNLHFYRCRNIYYHDKIIFPKARQVIFDGCDNNFIYYWFDQLVFPKCTDFYLFTHPNKPDVLRRAPNV